MQFIAFQWLFIFLAPSAAPTGLNSTQIGYDSVTIIWTEVNYLLLNGELTGYNIQYGEEGSDIMATVYQPGSNRTRTLTGLMFGRTYSVRVSVVSTGGNGSPFTSVRVTTRQTGKLRVVAVIYIVLAHNLFSESSQK